MFPKTKLAARRSRERRLPKKTSIPNEAELKLPNVVVLAARKSKERRNDQRKSNRLETLSRLVLKNNKLILRISVYLDIAKSAHKLLNQKWYEVNSTLYPQIARVQDRSWMNLLVKLNISSEELMNNVGMYVNHNCFRRGRVVSVGFIVSGLLSMPEYVALDDSSFQRFGLNTYTTQLRFVPKKWKKTKHRNRAFSWRLCTQLATKAFLRRVVLPLLCIQISRIFHLNLSDAIRMVKHCVIESVRDERDQHPEMFTVVATYRKETDGFLPLTSSILCVEPSKVANEALWTKVSAAICQVDEFVPYRCLCSHLMFLHVCTRAYSRKNSKEWPMTRWNGFAVDLDAIDRANGLTALHYACLGLIQRISMVRNIEAATIVIDKMILPFQRRRSRIDGLLRVVDNLICAGGNPNAPSQQGRTPLGLLCTIVGKTRDFQLWTDITKPVKLLVHRGATVLDSNGVPFAAYLCQNYWYCTSHGTCANQFALLESLLPERIWNGDVSARGRSKGRRARCRAEADGAYNQKMFWRTREAKGLLGSVLAHGRRALQKAYESCAVIRTHYDGLQLMGRILIACGSPMPSPPDRPFVSDTEMLLWASLKTFRSRIQCGDVITSIGHRLVHHQKATWAW